MGISCNKLRVYCMHYGQLLHPTIELDPRATPLIFFQTLIFIIFSQTMHALVFSKLS